MMVMGNCFCCLHCRRRRVVENVGSTLQTVYDNGHLCCSVVVYEADDEIDCLCHDASHLFFLLELLKETYHDQKNNGGDMLDLYVMRLLVMASSLSWDGNCTPIRFFRSSTMVLACVDS